MKTFFMKIFLLICAAVAICEGVLLFLAGSGYIPPARVVSFYNYLMLTPDALRTLLGAAIGLILLGLVLLLMALGSRKEQKSILIDQRGEVLSISMDAVRDFIHQILERNPYMSDFETAISERGKWIHIDIFATFRGDLPARQHVAQMRKILREQIEHVFGFSHFRINFRMKGIKIGPGEKLTESKLVDISAAAVEEKPRQGDAAGQGHESASLDAATAAGQNPQGERTADTPPWET